MPKVKKVKLVRCKECSRAPAAKPQEWGFKWWPNFSERPEEPFDVAYCGCRGWE